MTWDADCLMDTERTTMVQRRPDIYNQYTKRIMNAMTKGSHPWGAGSISKRLFPLIEDAMRHLENGTAAMFDYLIHDGRKTIELEELSTLIPQAWSINRKYVNALNSTERNNVVYEAENLAYRLWKLRFPTLVHVALLFSENNQHKIMGFGHIIVKCWNNIRNIGEAFRVVDNIEHYQHMVIERAGPACNMLLAPYNMDVPPFDHTDIDVEQWCHQWCIEGLPAYEYRRSQKDVKLEIEFEGEHFSTLPFHEFMVPEQGHDWFPSRKVLMDIWREAPTDPIWDGKIYEQPARTNIFTPKIRKEKHIRVYQVRHVHRRDSNETVTSSRVGPQSSGSTYTKEQNKKISNAKSSVVQWETGKVHPVPAPREHKLNTYQVRSLSPTPVVMSDGPSPLFDPPHTIDEKETPSIANCWRLNEKNEESRDKIKQYTRTLDDDDMVEHLDILDKETQLITEWTTLGTGKYTWAWAGAIKNKKGKILGHSSSKNDALAIAMANGS